jgi:hypothetical protein
MTSKLINVRLFADEELAAWQALKSANFNVSGVLRSQMIQFAKEKGLLTDVKKEEETK